jgi:hypothetical protein
MESTKNAGIFIIASVDADGIFNNVSLCRIYYESVEHKWKNRDRDGKV